MTESRAIATISHWIGCDYQTAKNILNGDYFWNGHVYSAFLACGGEALEICKDSRLIHHIITI